MRMKRNQNKDKSQKWVVSQNSHHKDRSPFLPSDSEDLCLCVASVGEARSSSNQQAEYIQRNHPHNCCKRCNNFDFNIDIQSLDISSGDCLFDNDKELSGSACAFYVPPPHQQALTTTESLTSRSRIEQDTQYIPQSQEAIEPRSNSKNKKEKMGLFRNLRRRLSSFKKSENSDYNGQIVDNNETSPNFSDVNTTPISGGSRREKNRSEHNSHCNIVSNGCDNVNSSLQKFISPKYNDLHSNTNRPTFENGKEKRGCVSKNISVLRYSNSSVHCDSHNLDDAISECAGIPSGHQFKCSKKPSEAVELVDCIDYDPIKEQTKIWSPKVWSLTQELFRLSKFGWYWGPITRNEAEDKLTNQPDGAFLVRDSSDERYLLSLSFRSYGVTLHTRIEHCNGMFSFYSQPDSEGYPSIVDLIEHSMKDAQTGIFYYSRSRSPDAPQFPVRLTKPVSRFTQVRSLQYLTRFVIRQYTRYDHIQQLPLPSTLKGWIEENQY